MTRTKIMEVTQEYGKLASILPEEIEDSNIIDELISIRDKIMKSIAADGEDLKTLLIQKDKQVDYQKLENVDNLIEKGFYKKGQGTQNELEFYYSHWTMACQTINLLSKAAIEIATELRKYYLGYLYGGELYDKKGYYARFIRTYMDFNGYVINLQGRITDYHDNLIRTYNFVEPENKQPTIIAFKSDTSPDQLISAVKELLLLGNYGRMSGFPLLRAAMEVFMTRELFDTKKNEKYKNCKIKFTKTIPSVASICRNIVKSRFR